MDEIIFKLKKELTPALVSQKKYYDNENRIASIDHLHKISNYLEKKYDIAFLNIYDKKNIIKPNLVRQHLYSLYKPQGVNIIDLGDLIYEDKNIFFNKIIDIFNLLNYNNTKLILISDNEKYNLFFFKYFNEINKKIKILNIDSRIDILGETENLSYLSNSKNYKCISNLQIIGYQNYLVGDIISQKAKKEFNIYRLSEVTAEISEIEPNFRNSDFVSLDISAVKSSDAPGSSKSSPNGFNSNEICKLAYFSGLSENIKVFGLHEINNKLDFNQTTSKLSAQIIWHFIDAYALNKKVNGSNKEFVIYYLDLEYNKIDIKLKFYHCKNTNRWWLEVIEDTNNNILACTNKDYELVKNKKLSKRLKSYFFQKYK